MMTQPTNGLRTFFIVWFGQLISLIGSQLTGFALSVWVYDETRSVMWIALTQIALFAPHVILAPLAGVLADRWNRRTAMIVSDLGAGSAVLTAAILYLTGHLEPWMVVPINFMMSAFVTLMWPAFSASMTLLVPKEHYGRANGFVQLGEAIPQIAGPALAGALYVGIHLGNMALIDAATYLVAVLLLLAFVRIPRPQETDAGREGKGNIWQEMRFGWDYIIQRRGLLALLTFFLVLNFVTGVMAPLFTPLILDNWEADTLGYVTTIMGVGMLAGTLVMSAWGGGKRKVYTLLGAGVFASFFLSLIGLRISIPLLVVCGFGFMFFIPLLDGSSQAIWQAKVHADVQGRVFAVRRAIAWSAQIVAPLLAAPLADHVFKPGMSEGGWLAGILGPIVGVGENHGIGVLISTLGLLALLVCVVSFLSPHIRNVEIDLPDQNAAIEATPLIEKQPAD
jgi:MFS family permease